MKRIVLLLGFSLAVALVAAPVASAHAILVSASPLPGAVLRVPPRQLDLYFDDVVRPLVGEVVRNSDGRVVSTAVRNAGPSHVAITLRAGLGKGAYTVRWQVLSDDGHRVGSVYAYGVGVGTPPPIPSLAPPPSGVTWLDVLVRGLLYAGVLVAFGALAFGDLVWQPVLRRFARDGADVETAVAGGVRLVSRIAASACYVASSAAAAEIVRMPNAVTRFGRLTTALVVAAAIGCALALIASASASRPRRRVLLALTAAVSGFALVTPSLGGHALDGSQPAILSLVVDIAHVAAAGVWIGGLVVLVLLVPMATRALEPTTRRALLAATARRFSVVALTAVTVIVVSGAIRALFELATPEQLLTTTYGRLLMVKIVLLTLLVGAGFLNRVRFVPRVVAEAERPGAGVAFAMLRRNVAVELVLLAGALAAVALLVQSRPGIG
jgi:copper transport protein